MIPAAVNGNVDRALIAEKRIIRLPSRLLLLAGVSVLSSLGACGTENPTLNYSCQLPCLMTDWVLAILPTQTGSTSFRSHSKLHNPSGSLKL